MAPAREGNPQHWVRRELSPELGTAMSSREQVDAMYSMRWARPKEGRWPLRRRRHRSRAWRWLRTTGIRERDLQPRYVLRVRCDSWLNTRPAPRRWRDLIQVRPMSC